jgi:threonine dehydrogenase-like Zn-dependent dehydrogenase
VLVEPLACAVHCALRADVHANADVLVIGAGTVGILTLLALKELTRAGSIVVVAKHQRQREWAESFGATDVVSPGEAINEVRRSTRALKLKPERGSPFLLGGVDVVIDCVGSKGSLDLALRTTKAGGRIVLAGIPVAGVDLTPLWFRELELVGAYTGGIEKLGRKGSKAKGSSNADGTSAFDIATDIAAATPLDGIVGATYPLRRWRSAIDHALGAGRLGTLKVAFDLRAE